jgi:hypothetical protein
VARGASGGRTDAGVGASGILVDAGVGASGILVDAAAAGVAAGANAF